MVILGQQVYELTALLLISLSNVQVLSNIKGLSDAKVDKICEAAERIVVSITSRIAIFAHGTRISSVYVHDDKKLLKFWFIKTESIFSGTRFSVSIEHVHGSCSSEFLFKWSRGWFLITTDSISSKLDSAQEAISLTK